MPASAESHFPACTFTLSSALPHGLLPSVNSGLCYCSCFLHEARPNPIAAGLPLPCAPRETTSHLGAGCLSTHLSPIDLGAWPGAFSDTGSLLSDWGRGGSRGHPGEAQRPEHPNTRNELTEGNLIFHIINKLEKNYNGYGNHTTCVWRYLRLGDYRDPQSWWQAGWWGAGPPILVVLALSYHCTNAGQPNSFGGHKFTPS